VDKYTDNGEHEEIPRLEIIVLVGPRGARGRLGNSQKEELSPSVEPGLVLVVRRGLHIRLWLNLTHLLVHAWLHMHGVLDVRGGWLLELLLLLLLLLELLLGAIVVRWWRHRSWGRHGISGVRVHGSSEIGMGQCFGGSDALGGVKLQ